MNDMSSHPGGVSGELSLAELAALARSPIHASLRAVAEDRLRRILDDLDDHGDHGDHDEHGDQDEQDR